MPIQFEWYKPFNGPEEVHLPTFPGWLKIKVTWTYDTYFD